MTRYAPQQKFCAPELFAAETWKCLYSLSVDVYSFGKLMEWLIEGYPPGDETNDLLTQICFLIIQCTQNDPQRRPPMVANLSFLEELTSRLTKSFEDETQL